MMLMAGIVGFSSCDSNEQHCGDGFNLCFDLDGTPVSVYAEWYEKDPDRFRIHWEHTQGTGNQKLEIDLHDLISVRNYTVNDTENDGTSKFLYHVNDGITPTRNYVGTSGNISISEFNANKITGHFSVSVIETNASTTHSITDGHFYAIPKE